MNENIIKANKAIEDAKKDTKLSGETAKKINKLKEGQKAETKILSDE
jgi:hypothetical protein